MRHNLAVAICSICLIACNDTVVDSSCECTASETCVDDVCRPQCNRETECADPGMTCRDSVCRPAECGNEIVEAGEACDGNCPTTCVLGPTCTESVMLGEPSQCNAICTLVATLDCAAGDGCCPPGCDTFSDADCGGGNGDCGDGILDPLEICDGDCPTSCEDADDCTADVLTGSAANCSARCVHAPIEACAIGDGCCPAACDWTNDADCTCVGLPHTEFRCDQGDVYWFDSCGVREELMQSCAGSPCIDGACVPSCAPEWQNTDIGVVSLPGSASCSGAEVTIVASGADIWGTADEMHYVYQPLSGDGWIEARVVSNEGGADWSKTGVMIRESLAPDSVHAHALVSKAATNPVKLDRREIASGITSGIYGPLVSPPYWVRLARRGDFFSGYESSDGVHWTWLGTHTISMDADVSIGLTLTSHDNSTLATAVFDNVTVNVSSVPECFVAEDCDGGGSCDQGSCTTGPSSVSFVPAAYQVNEDAGSVTVGVTRTGSGSGACTLTWATSDDTASAGVDFSTASGSLSWNDDELGEKTATIAVLDRSGDQGNRAFTVVVTASSCSDTMAGDTATVTIRDTDGPPPVGAWSQQGPSGCADPIGSFDGFIPGMRGFGSCTRGGFVPGTNVISVTNLNTSGSGSFAAAMAASCPKVILFDVAGHVDNGTNEAIGSSDDSCSNYSIVGASAPGQFAYTGGDMNGAITLGGSDWTIDHMVITTHGRGSSVNDGSQSRDALQYGWTGNTSNRIALNSAFVWGFDEDVQCYYSPSYSTSKILMWQSIIGLGIGFEPGVPTQSHQFAHIINWNCLQVSNIRNVYIHASGRTPFTRADGMHHANNITFNPGFQNYLSQPCGSGGANNVNYRQNVQWNFFMHGPDSLTGATRGFEWQSNPCKTGSYSIYEANNAGQNALTQQVYDCANHGCSRDAGGFAFVASPDSYATPPGYVPETFDTSSDAELTAFANQILDHVGPRPMDRLSYLQSRVIDQVKAGLAGNAGGMGNHAGLGEAGRTAEGGFTALTDSGSWNASAQCGGMPTGAAADAIQSSGLTALHEWVIGCFYDNVMPSGYREDGLENYPAP